MLSEQELTHYSRHLILPQFGAQGQKKLKRTRVLIIGLGGLGPPVPFYLAASGIGTLVLADNDTPAVTNLQRQIIHKYRSLGQPKVESAKETIAELNPWIPADSQLTIYDVLNTEFRKLNISKKPACPICRLNTVSS